MCALAAPVRFDCSGLLEEWTRTPTFDVRAIVSATGNVPWQLMQSAFHMLRPTLTLSKAAHVLDKANQSDPGEFDDFLDGFCDLPETMEVRRAAAKVLDALNGWIHSQGRHDPELAGMGCTFTALVLRGRVAHVLHVGDTRAYRLRGDRLTCLTNGHVRQGGTGRSGILYRAVGVEAEVRLDYASQAVGQHDRFLLCSDGADGFLTDESIADILRERSAPEDTAGALVAAALQSGSTDNCTALVLDVVALPTAGSADISAAILQLPIIPVPVRGETIDGFVLKALISDGRYTRLFGAHRFHEVRMEDIARVELSAQSWTSSVAMNGQHAVFIGIQATPTGEPVAVTDRDGLPAVTQDYNVSLDVTPTDAVKGAGDIAPDLGVGHLAKDAAEELVLSHHAAETKGQSHQGRQAEEHPGAGQQHHHGQDRRGGHDRQGRVLPRPLLRRRRSLDRH